MVYFITDGFHTKIGMSGDVEERLRGLHTANPRILKVALVFKGGLEQETEFHKLFFGKQTQALNEWYSMSPEEMVPKIIDKLGMLGVVHGINRAKRNSSTYEFSKDLVGAKDQRMLNQSIIKKCSIQGIE